METGKFTYKILERKKLSNSNTSARCLYLIHFNTIFVFRFGSGIIIYWLGYLDQVATCLENKDFIIVTDEFPKKEELIILNLPFK